MTMRIGERAVTGRDVIALIALAVLLAALVGSAVWLELRTKAIADAKARAAAEAVIAAQPKRAPPITTSVYVRFVPVRHAQ